MLSGHGEIPGVLCRARSWTDYPVCPFQLRTCVIPPAGTQDRKASYETRIAVNC